MAGGEIVAVLAVDKYASCVSYKGKVTTVSEVSTVQRYGTQALLD